MLKTGQNISQKQSQQQKLSPQQIQFVKLLQLPTIGLEQRIKEEIEMGDELIINAPDFPESMTYQVSNDPKKPDEPVCWNNYDYTYKEARYYSGLKELLDKLGEYIERWEED